MLWRITNPVPVLSKTTFLLVITGFYSQTRKTNPLKRHFKKCSDIDNYGTGPVQISETWDQIVIHFIWIYCVLLSSFINMFSTCNACFFPLLNFLSYLYPILPSGLGVFHFAVSVPFFVSVQPNEIRQYPWQKVFTNRLGSLPASVQQKLAVSKSLPNWRFSITENTEMFGHQRTRQLTHVSSAL